MSKEGNSITDEVKYNNTKYTLSKYEYDLYNEESDIKNTLVQVKRDKDIIKVLCDGKQAFIIDLTKLSDEEVNLCNTVGGMKYIISSFKEGNTTLSKMRKSFRQKLES